MNKLAKLFTSIDNFYKKTILSYLFTESNYKKAQQSFTMPDDPEEVSSGNNLDIISQSDKYDIKDEELYNQFESFMNAYKELIDSLSVNPQNLTADSLQEATQLIDVLNTRYVRIINNPYLNMTSNEGYEEDFDPGEFTAFIQRVVSDAESRLKDIAGEDADIGEMKSSQYAQEFNQQMVDRGDKNITFTGDKIQQLLEARRNWFKNLMFIKKVGKSHPEYDRFENYIKYRKNSYKNIMNDPERREVYRDKAKSRQEKFRKSLNIKKKELQDLLKSSRDSKKISELQKEISNIDEQLGKRKAQEIERASKVKKIKESGTLFGLIVHLQQQIATQKNEAVKSIKSKAAKDPYFNEIKKTVQYAKEKVDQDPSLSNKNALEEAIRNEAEIIKKYLNEHQAIIKIKQDLVVLYDFRDAIKNINEMTNLSENKDFIPEEIKPIINKLIMEGEQLISIYGKIYRSPSNTISLIIDALRSKL